MSRNYSSQVTQKNPITTVDDVINSRYDNIHQQLYEHALAKYFSYNGISPDEYYVLELHSSQFDSPSKAKLVSKEYPYKSKVINLSPYWEEYQFNKNGADVLIDEEDSVDTAELKYKDYVRGVAEMESRITGVRFNVALKTINEETKQYPDEHSINNTFSYKVNNKIYGE